MMLRDPARRGRDPFQTCLRVSFLGQTNVPLYVELPHHYHSALWPSCKALLRAIDRATTLHVSAMPRIRLSGHHTREEMHQ